ncbi:PAS domain S-box protein [Haladaptatus halobius]|uniref:PAS domain S-box protein n=1 Tax=Haladaptatus halobius TaxID=2884875 RepID=UPI001D0ACD44|nr:PAS domain S-box protein [Haladaptatus halobius]
MSSPSSSKDIYEETLTVFEQTNHPNEPLTSPEVAEALGCPRRTVYKRLENLVDKGELRTKKVGSSARVWWQPPTNSTDHTPTASGTDNSEQRRLEDELRATKTWYQHLVEQTLVGIYIVQNGEMKYVNPKFANILGYSQDEVIGESALDFVAEDDQALVAENFRKREHGEVNAIRYDAKAKHADGTLVDVEVHGGLIEYKGEQAILGIMVDMSERMQRERALEESERRYRTLAEHFPNGVVALFDHDLRYTLVTGSPFDNAELSPEDIEGRPVGETALDSNELLKEHYQAALSGEKRTFEIEWGGHVLQTWTLPVRDEAGSVFAGMVMTQDLTNRIEHERELERYETIFETINDGVYSVDSEGCFTMVNEAYAKMVGHDREELLGEHVSLVVDETVVTTAQEIEQDMRTSERAPSKVEAKLQQADGGTITAEATFALLPGDSTHERVGVVRDISERKERERQLEQYERLVETVEDGVYAVDANAQFVTVNDAFCEMVGWEREELLGRHATTVHADEITPRAEKLAAEVAANERDDATIELELHTKHGDRIPAESRLRPFPITGGVGRCGVVRDISERKKRERDLERQRQELAALNDLHTAVRSVTDLVIEQSTRDEIEQRVCEQLAESDIYDFAWIGQLARNGKEITVNATSKETEQLAETTVPLDEKAPTEHGPVAQAANTRSPHLSWDIFEDSTYDKWTIDRDYQDHSMLAVPIIHDGRLYGVLTLYTDRSFVMGDVEQEIIQQLGEVIGHAITAIERKQLLLADRLIEVEYHSKTLAEPFIEATDSDLDISIDRTIPLADGEFLQYYTFDGLTAEQPHELLRKFSSVTNVRVLFDKGEQTRVEVRTSSDTISSLFTTFGGRTKNTKITDNELRIIGELPATAQIREVTEAVKEIYPDMMFAGQQYVTRQQMPPAELRTVFEDSLTDRQRIALEAAFYSGFFEWPRKSSGENVAESLDISSSTFHQHIRKAEKKLLGVVFAET